MSKNTDGTSASSRTRVIDVLPAAHGVTKEELTELITRLAFYPGWPSANTAVGIVQQVFAEAR